MWPVEFVAKTEVERQPLRDLPLVVDEGEERAMARARLIDDRQISADAVRQIEQERSEIRWPAR
jgi:hypothetical protein